MESISSHFCALAYMDPLLCAQPRVVRVKKAKRKRKFCPLTPVIDRGMGGWEGGIQSTG